MFAELASIPLEFLESESFYAEFNVKNNEVGDVMVSVEGPVKLSISPTKVRLKCGTNCDFLVHFEPESCSELQNATISVVCEQMLWGVVVQLTEYVVKVVRGERKQFERTTPDSPIDATFKLDCFKCKICLMDYNDSLHAPRALRCGHTICTTCAEVLWNEGKRTRVRCPFDRTETVVQSESHRKSIEMLPKNFTIVEILQLRNPKTREELAIEAYKTGIKMEKTLRVKLRRLKFLTSCLTPEHPLIDKQVTSIEMISDNDKKERIMEKFYTLVQNRFIEYIEARDETEEDLQMVKGVMDQIEKRLEESGPESAAENSEGILELAELFKVVNCSVDPYSSHDPVAILRRFSDSSEKFEEESSSEESSSSSDSSSSDDDSDDDNDDDNDDDDEDDNDENAEENNDADDVVEQNDDENDDESEDENEDDDDSESDSTDDSDSSVEPWYILRRRRF